MKGHKLLNPFYQRKFRYLIFDGGKLLGEVFVLDPQFICEFNYIVGLKCVRK